MQIPSDKWYGAIFERRSRRQYDGRPLPEETVSSLVDLSLQLNEHIKGARVVVVNEKPDKVFKGAVGSYGKIKGAPAYAVFIGNMRHSNVQEKVGVQGEYFILEATAIGLATCWVGGFFSMDAVKGHITLKDEEKILAVTPLGFADPKFTLEERLMSGFAKSHKRKELEALLLSPGNEPLPSWIGSALEAARLAPSAVNRQPWRFSVENNTIRVSLDSSRDPFHVSKRLDCGIAMAHIEIAARHEGISGQWEYLTGQDVSRFKPL